MADGEADERAEPRGDGPPAAPQRTRRRLPMAAWIAIGLGSVAVALRLVALVVLWRHDTSPVAEGYHSVGAVDGTTYWVRSHGTDVDVRTTGRHGGHCEYHGSLVESPGVVAALGPSSPLGEICDDRDLRGGETVTSLLDVSAYGEAPDDGYSRTTDLPLTDALPGYLLEIAVTPPAR